VELHVMGKGGIHGLVRQLRRAVMRQDDDLPDGQLLEALSSYAITLRLKS
jgi:hypothetical protein